MRSPWGGRSVRLRAGDKPTSTLRDEAVKILPMHTARGLQFRIVLLPWAVQLPSPFKNRNDGVDQGLLYVAMTRAEDILVILHSGSSSYVEEHYARRRSNWPATDHDDAPWLNGALPTSQSHWL